MYIHHLPAPAECQDGRRLQGYNGNAILKPQQVYVRLQALSRLIEVRDELIKERLPLRDLQQRQTSVQPKSCHPRQRISAPEEQAPH